MFDTEAKKNVKGISDRARSQSALLVRRFPQIKANVLLLERLLEEMDTARRIELKNVINSRIKEAALILWNETEKKKTLVQRIDELIQAATQLENDLNGKLADPNLSLTTDERLVIRESLEALIKMRRRLALTIHGILARLDNEVSDKLHKVRSELDSGTKKTVDQAIRTLRDKLGATAPDSWHDQFVNHIAQLERMIADHNL